MSTVFKKFSDPTSATLLAYYNPAEPNTLEYVPGQEPLVQSLKSADGTLGDEATLYAENGEVNADFDSVTVVNAGCVLANRVTGAKLQTNTIAPSVPVSGYSVVVLGQNGAASSAQWSMIGASLLFDESGSSSWMRVNKVSTNPDTFETQARVSYTADTVDIPLAFDPETWVMINPSTSNTPSVYHDGVLLDSDYNAVSGNGNINKIAMLNYAQSPDGHTPQPYRMAIMAVYDGDLSPTDVGHLQELMEYWRDNGSAPSDNSAPSFTSHPDNVSVEVPNPTSFTASATGVPTPTLQWKCSDDEITWYDVDDPTNGLASTIQGSATNNRLDISLSAVGDNGKKIALFASNIEQSDVQSNSATYTVTQEVVYPENGSFGPVATNDPDAEFTWRCWRTSEDSDWGPYTNLSNARVGTTNNPNDTLFIDSAIPSDAGRIQVTATTTYGEITSEGTLNVVPGASS